MRRSDRILFHGWMAWMIAFGMGAAPWILPAAQAVAIQDDNEAAASDRTLADERAEFKREAERWLPAETLVYAQVAPLEVWWEHPLRSRLVQTEIFQKFWKSSGVLKARSGIAVAELAVGMKLEVLLRRVTAGGVYAAIDARTGGVVVLARAHDEKWLKRTATKMVEVARNNRGDANGESGIGSSIYRGVACYQVDQVFVGLLGPWLMVANEQELARSVIDRFVDGNDASLQNVAWRRSETYGPRLTVDPHAWDSDSLPIATVEIDLGKARALFPRNDLFRKPAKDFGAELLLGGILALLQNAPGAALEVKLEPNGLAAELSFPSEVQWFADSREHYVGPNAQGRSLPLMEVEDALVSLSTYRDLSQLWLRAGDLFDQNVNDQLAQADNTLTTLFSGKDFGSDILGAIEPELRMVAAHRTWEPDQLQPSVKLPAFAMIARLKDPATMRKELKRIFQSVIGFLNIVGAMEGQPQLELMSESSETGPIYWAEYVVDADRKYENGLPIQFNFSPAIAFVDDQVILSSSLELSRRLADSCGQHANAAAPPTTQENTVVRVDAESLKRVLEANRESLIAQNMLEKGHSRTEAIEELGILFGILDMVRRAQLALVFDARSTMTVRVDYR